MKNRKDIPVLLAPLFVQEQVHSVRGAIRLGACGLLLVAPLLAAAHPVFGDSGFEGIAVTPGNFVQAPSSPVWSFTNVSNNASGVANGSGSWGTGGNSGQKYAYVQRGAQLSQTVNGFVPGRQYEVRYAMTRRSGSVGGNDPNRIGVQIDGTTVSTVETINDSRWRTMKTPAFTATGSSMNFRWQGLSGDDRTSLFDDFQVVEASPRIGVLADGDFEVANYLPSGWSYNPGPILGSDWTFTNQNNTLKSGTASVGSPWGNSAATGRHFAFIQQAGVLSQTLTNLHIGTTYYVKFSHNRRTDNPGHRLRVLVNGIEVLASTEAPPTWTARTSLGFVATSSTMSLSFVGSSPNSGDTTSLVDNVQVVPEPSVLATLLAGCVALNARRKKSRSR